MKTNTFIIRDIPPSLWKIARHRAIDEGKTLKQIVLDALQAYLEKGEPA